MSEDIEPEEEEFDDSGYIEPTKDYEKPKIRGSASLIEDYRSCPAKAYARITKQPSQGKSASLALGSAVHETLEKFIKHQVDPLLTFNREFKDQSDKNGIALGTPDSEKARAGGLLCLEHGLKILNHKMPNGKYLYEAIEPEYVERAFNMYRNGRLYVGKIDFMMFMENETYSVIDWKTGKLPPAQESLDKNIQFSMYAWATSNDETDRRTYGKMMHHGTYIHLRGQSTELDKAGKRVPITRLKDPNNYKTDFRTTRTPEFVENEFVTKIEPVMAAMEDQVWYRNEGTYANPCRACSYFDKSKERCTAEIPVDGIGKYPMRSTVEELVAQLPVQTNLLDHPKKDLDERKAPGT